MPLKNSEYANVLSGYLETSVSITRPFYHTDLKNNLEGIVFNGQHEKGKGVLEKVFSDKGKTLKATIKALFNEIKLRENLDSLLLNKIDKDICNQNYHLMQLDNLKVHYMFDRFMEVKSKIQQIQDNMLELEKEKRKEYLECWRDLMFLKKYLLTSLKDYWDLIKKRNVLSYDFTQLIKNENTERC